MKVQIYFSLYFFILLCIPVYSYKNLTKEAIYTRLHVQQKLCGTVLADTLGELCLKYNGYRARRSILDCCKKSCTFYYLMKYFCEKSRVDLDDLPSSLASPTESETETSKVPQSSEHVSQSSENNESRQGPLQNKIQRQPPSEEIKHKPAQYGYVRSTRPPIIYRHSNTISRGAMNYQIPNQSNSSQQ